MAQLFPTSPLIAPRPRSRPAQGRGGSFIPPITVNPQQGGFGFQIPQQAPFGTSIPSIVGDPMSPMGMPQMDFITPAMAGGGRETIIQGMHDAAPAVGRDYATKVIRAVDDGVADPKLANPVLALRQHLAANDFEGARKDMDKFVNAVRGPRLKDDPGTFLIDLFTRGALTRTWEAAAANLAEDIWKRELNRPTVEQAMTIPGFGPENLTAAQKTVIPGFGGGEEGPNEELAGKTVVRGGMPLNDLQVLYANQLAQQGRRPAGTMTADAAQKQDLLNAKVRAFIFQHGRNPNPVEYANIVTEAYTGGFEKIAPPDSAEGQQQAIKAEVAKRTLQPTVDKAFAEVNKLDQDIRALKEKTDQGILLAADERRALELANAYKEAEIDNIRSMIKHRPQEERMKLMRDQLDTTRERIALAKNEADLSKARAMIEESRNRIQAILTVASSFDLSDKDSGKLLADAVKELGIILEVSEKQKFLDIGKPKATVKELKPRATEQTSGGTTPGDAAKTDKAKAEADEYLRKQGLIP